MAGWNENLRVLLRPVLGERTFQCICISNLNHDWFLCANVLLVLRARDRRAVVRRSYRGRFSQTERPTTQNNRRRRFITGRFDIIFICSPCRWAALWSIVDGHPADWNVAHRINQMQKSFAVGSVRAKTDKGLSWASHDMVYSSLPLADKALGKSIRFSITTQLTTAWKTLVYTIVFSNSNCNEHSAYCRFFSLWLQKVLWVVRLKFFGTKNNVLFAVRSR